MVRIAISILSAAWLIPLWRGVNSYLSFLQVKAAENSFPFLSFAKNCFAISFAWLGLVILFWSYRWFTATPRKSGP